MAKFPALPLWTDALIGDTFHLTPAQFGAYLRLLIVEWRTPDCSLPNDDIFLGRSVGDPKNWHRLKPIVMPYFTLGEDGRYRQKRLLDERDSCSRYAERSASGHAAKALKRKHRDSAKPLPTGCLEPAPYSSPSPNSKEVSSKLEGAASPPPPKTVKKFTTPIPDNFPKASDLDAARAYWFEMGRDDLDPSREAQGFNAHHKGHGKRMADWGQAWVTWYTNAPKFNRKPNGGQNGRKSNHERAFDVAKELAADLAAGRWQPGQPRETSSSRTASITLLPTRPKP